MSGHFHITPLGGAAGDLFGTEMLDAFPEFINPVITGTIAVPPHRNAKSSQCSNSGIAGRNSTVPEQNETAPIIYPDMDGILKAADLADAPQRHARAILRLLAEVEATAHDMPLNQVHFDELTYWDTLTAADVSIELLDRWNWSIDPPSLGRATERTWHGLSHVPAPETAHLLSGLTAQDDGIGGEPLTPPEAAIIRHIVDHITLRSRPMGRFQATGYCAGTRVPPGMVNVVVVRVICGAAQSRDTVEVFEWDIDDMIGEEIAVACNLLALIRLRIGSGQDDTGRQKRPPHYWVSNYGPTGSRGCGISGRFRSNRYARASTSERRPTVSATRGQGWRQCGGAPNGRTYEDRKRHCRRSTDTRSALGPNARSVAMNTALTAALSHHEGIAIAVNGGVDSATLANVVLSFLGQRARTIHAMSLAVLPVVTARVRELALRVDWRLDLVDAGEFDYPQYRVNSVIWCFFCKSDLNATMARLARETITSGTKRDDLGDFRPGLDAAKQWQVVHPYGVVGLDKPAINTLAKDLGADDLVALRAPSCLASRVETGTAVTVDDWTFVDHIETLLRADLRMPASVRYRITHAAVIVETEDDTPPASIVNACLETCCDYLDHRQYDRGAAFLRAES